MPSTSQSQRGATLTELLVVLGIMSILAMMAVPFAETAVHRGRESELRQTLRMVRQAIDNFHDDWKLGNMADAGRVASKNGYPLTLQILVDGVNLSHGAPDRRRYLRSMPENPFASGAQIEGNWRLLGYSQTDEQPEWNGEDVYDLRAVTARKGLDGTQISDW